MKSKHEGEWETCTFSVEKDSEIKQVTINMARPP